MTSRNTIVTAVIILALISVLLSGCIGEEKTAKTPESLQKEVLNVSSPNLTQSPIEEKNPEISIESFTGIYMRDNSGNKTWASYNISEGYYAAYNLTIKNNGKDSFYFTTKELRLQEGDRIFNTTTTLPPYDSNLVEVLSEIIKENKIQYTTLLPGQIIHGSVVFRIDSLYNKSFLLTYNTTPITSTSFEKNIDALWKAEHFNYSIASGIPPYCNCSERGGTTGSYEPKFDDYCDTWANWVNRSIFETFQKSDMERMIRSPPDNIPLTKMAYALRVFPEKNITMFPITTGESPSNFLIIDDTGKEMTNTSNIAGVAVLSNQTYALFKPRWKLIMPRMNFSNVSVVRISFEGTYGENMGLRLSFVNQDVILDEDLNIIAVRYSRDQFVS